MVDSTQLMKQQCAIVWHNGNLFFVFLKRYTPVRFLLANDRYVFIRKLCNHKPRNFPEHHVKLAIHGPCLCALRVHGVHDRRMAYWLDRQIEYISHCKKCCQMNKFYTIPWVCYERSFSEFYLSIWNQLVFNQRPQLFVRSPQPYLLFFASRN